MRIQHCYILGTMLLCLLLSACNQSVPSKSEPEIIREMIISYGKDPDNSSDTVDQLLIELKKVNESEWNRWQEIMDYWDYANNDMQLNYDSLPDTLPQDNSLCLVVLGYQLNADGSIRPELEGRLNTALTCAKQYPNAYILCTGGGTAANNHSVTEAGEMAKWLINNGLEPQRILIEDNSLSTVQNAVYSFELITSQYPHITSIAIITSDYHVPWGAVLFQTEFLLSQETQHLSVLSNAAFFANNQENYSVIRYQTSGILELAGIK